MPLKQEYRSMRPFLVILLGTFLGSLASLAQAQDQRFYMGSSQQPIQISVGVSYQQYADEDRQLSQLGFPFRAFVPFTPHIGFAVITNPVLIEADSQAPVDGMSDAQVALSYFRNIGAGSIVVSLGANLPSGKRELTTDEFATIALLSQDFYSFAVPVLGQGFNLAPGVTVAYPINNNVVVGAGASYQLKGEYKPVTGMDEGFTPGDELMVTGGLDVRVAPAWALSANVSYVIYQEDTLGDVSVFESGDQIFVTLQGLGNLGTNQLRMTARYRGKAKSQLPVGDQVTTAPRTVPQQFSFTTTYGMRIQSNLTATLLGRVGHYEETDFFASKTRFDLGAYQEYQFDELVGAVLRFVYTFGSFPGVEIGGGLTFSL